MFIGDYTVLVQFCKTSCVCVEIQPTYSLMQDAGHSSNIQCKTMEDIFIASRMELWNLN